MFSSETSGIEYSWLFQLLFNLLGYCSIGVPAATFVWYSKRKELFLNDQNPRSWRSRFFKFVVHGNQDYERVSLESGPSPKKKVRTTLEHFCVLAFCFGGLQFSYLTWGVLQEKIMTQTYFKNADDHIGEKFHDSQFLVFVNKLSGFIVSSIYVYSTSSFQPATNVPFYKYSYCAISNIISSWCQYEALKFVSFPTQILAKTSKIIPVMLMGKLVSRKKYNAQEYLSAAMISLGMFLFLMGKPHSSTAYAEATTVAGIFLLFGYICCDAFTSNWQSKLFSKFKMSSMQMMCGVNFFSASLTFVTLLEQGKFGKSLPFLFSHHDFAFDCILQSVCSTTGQLFVFYTISQFGPVIFVTMMTIRQAVAIILSCIIYGHRFGLFGLWGLFFVFLSLSINVGTHCMRKRRGTSPTKSKVVKGTAIKEKAETV